MLCVQVNRRMRTIDLGVRILFLHLRTILPAAVIQLLDEGPYVATQRWNARRRQAREPAYPHQLHRESHIRLRRTSAIAPMVGMMSLRWA